MINVDGDYKEILAWLDENRPSVNADDAPVVRQRSLGAYHHTGILDDSGSHTANAGLFSLRHGDSERPNSRGKWQYTAVPDCDDRMWGVTGKEMLAATDARF